MTKLNKFVLQATAAMLALPAAATRSPDRRSSRSSRWNMRSSSCADESWPARPFDRRRARHIFHPDQRSHPNRPQEFTHKVAVGVSQRRAR